MTNRDIYERALALLAEELEEDCPDYEARAPYLLSLFFGECCGAEGFGSGSRGECPPVEDRLPELDEEFPLHPRFAGAGAFYLAALLVEGADGELSDRMFARYAEELCRITRGGTSHPIRDVYGFED